MFVTLHVVGVTAKVVLVRVHGRLRRALGVVVEVKVRVRCGCTCTTDSVGIRHQVRQGEGAEVLSPIPQDMETIEEFTFEPIQKQLNSMGQWGQECEDVKLNLIYNLHSTIHSLKRDQQRLDLR